MTVHKLLVGCPVRAREWIMEHWFAAVESAATAAWVSDVEYVFVCDERDPTVEVIRSRTNDAHFVWEPEEILEDRRLWGSDRYHRMVTLRNLLLAEVRRIGPDAFLSLDSDVLLHPAALANMKNGLDRFSAVGSKAYLGPRKKPAREYLNYATLLRSEGGLYRPEMTGLAKVDVIMAVKLMSPAAYNVDYRWHHNGEDVGWSIAVQQAGLQLGWDGSTTSVHVASPEALADV